MRFFRVWCRRIGAGDLEALLAETIAVAVKTEAVSERQLERITVDTTVQTKAVALAAIEVFKEKYGVKYPRAVTCLTKDSEAMLAFYDFPAEHWDHLRTSNPPFGECRHSPDGRRIESVFATVRHRTVHTKGADGGHS